MSHSSNQHFIMGSECEYPVKDARGGCTYSPWNNNLGQLQYCRNGGRLYRDAGGIEAATPECTSPRQLTDYEFSMMYALQQRINEKFRGYVLHKRDGIFPSHDQYRNQIDPGYHLNILVRLSRQEIEASRFLTHLSSHLVSAQVWAGTGAIGVNVPVIAPRCKRISNGKESELPIVEIRQDFGSACRIQVNIFGSNTTRYITWLKAGTSALVARYLEVTSKDSVMKNRSPNSPSRCFTNDLVSLATSEAGGIELAPYLNLQQQWHTVCHEMFYKKLGDEWDEVLNEWQKVIDYKSPDYTAHTERVVEWRSIQRKLELPIEEDSLYGADNIANREYPNALHEVLDRHTKTPPANTRAFFRGRIVTLWDRINNERLQALHAPLDISWESVVMHLGEERVTFRTDDPVQTYKRDLRMAYDTMKKALRSKIEFFEELYRLNFGSDEEKV